MNGGKVLRGRQPSRVTPRHLVSDDLQFERDYQVGEKDPIVQLLSGQECRIISVQVVGCHLLLLWD